MHRTGSARFMYISVFYGVFCALLTSLVHPKGAFFLLQAASMTEGHWKNLWKYMPILCLFVGAAFVYSRAYLDKERMRDALFALTGCLVFMWAFSMFKMSMPYILPYWADPMFARFDQILHFGTDPWRLIEPLRAPLGTELMDYVYLKLWAWPAVVGPLMLVIFDRDPERVSRYLMLFLFTWIFLGNVLALAFLSVGPVYHDRLLEADTFAALNAVLNSPEERASLMGIVREWLWVVKNPDYQGVSSGISAFPSVHVGVATLSCFYLCERSRYLAPLGILFLVLILLGSVLSGLHYAVDGYASFLVVSLAWFFTRQTGRVSDGSGSLASLRPLT